MNRIEKKHNFRVLEKLVDSDRIIFVFTAMGTSISQYLLWVRSLNKLGYSVIMYDYPARLVLDAELEAFALVYKGIEADANGKIIQLKPKHIYAYGISMGTVFANKLTRDRNDIEHVILCMTYGDIVTNIMQSPITARTRRNMTKKGLTVADIRRGVEFLDPIQNAAGLVNKKVWLHLSKKDKILTYDTTIKTKQAFEDAGVDLKYTESKYLGHYATGVAQIFSAKRIDEFFRS